MAVNDGPVAVAENVSTPEDTAVSGLVTAQDVDNLTSELVFKEGIGPVNGNLTVDANGAYTYTPNQNYNGLDVFTVVVRDPLGETHEITIAVNVVPVNDLPVTISNPEISVQDGETIQIDVTGLFADVDGDTLNITAQDLPDWLTLNLVTGELSGIVPFDASQNSPIEITVSAEDRDGIKTDAKITIDSENSAPEISTTISDQTSSVFDVVNIQLSENFVDGGFDRDQLRYFATGLPDGLEIDEKTGVISGVISAGAAANKVYDVTVVADDGQGGTTQQSFKYNISTDFGSQKPDVNDDLVQDTARRGTEFDGSDNLLENEDPIVTAATEEISGLRTIKSLSGVNGIVLDAIRRISSLREAISPGGSINPVTEQVLAIERLLADSASSTYETSLGEDWDVEGLTGYSLKFNVSGEAENAEGQNDGSKLIIETYVRKRILYIDVNNSLDPETDGRVTKYSVNMANGTPLPDWIRVAKDGFIIVERPADVRNLELTIAAELDSGNVISRSVAIDSSTGEIQPLKVNAEEKSSAPFSDQLRTIIRDESSSSDNLRSSLNNRNSK